MSRYPATDAAWQADPVGFWEEAAIDDPAILDDITAALIARNLIGNAND
ncbi:hypothetical protein [Rhodophyticola sp. CCM32]|nr:hypothetical protein [Rhodophyticola sp. CCM32]